MLFRSGNMLREGRELSNVGNQYDRVLYIPDVAVWTPALFQMNVPMDTTSIIRTYFYTATKGAQPEIAEVERQLKEKGIEAPRVFHKHKTKGSKQVDISLATDMLLHAARKHYDIAVLVAGDEDYVPLVEAVQGEGARVHVWFLPDGLSPALAHSADEYRNIEHWLLRPSA